MTGRTGEAQQRADPGITLASYADLVVAALGRNPLLRHAPPLLRGPWPGERDALLDSHSRLLRAHLDRVAAALAALPGSAMIALAAPPAAGPAPAAASPADFDELADRLARWLIGQLPGWPDAARRLAIATARLIEDSEVLHPAARHLRPLGRGFEPLLDERLRRRFALIPEHTARLDALRSNLQLLMEEPDQGVAAVERALGAPLTAGDRAWLDAERRAGLLRFVRRKKTEDGHIRWFLRKDDDHGVVLDRFGAAGHWIVCHAGSTAVQAKLGTAVERVMPAPPPTATGWRLVTVAGAHRPAAGAPPATAIDATYVLAAPPAPGAGPRALRDHVRRTASISHDAGAAVLASALGTASPGATASSGPGPGRRFALRGSKAGLTLWEQAGDVTVAVASVAHDPDDDQLLDFLESVECVADLKVPADDIGDEYRASPAAQWARALLRGHGGPEGGQEAALTARLVYIPSAIQHQLGGVPLVGLDFLRDRLERLGARVTVLTVPPADFGRRAAELLGADVIGIGVYIHNHDQVADLVARLRRAGYRGKIILGGPQLRDIDLIQGSVEGWDALIRGEAEDALPQVLAVLSRLEAGRWTEALGLARAMTGVAIRYGDAVLLCGTAERNRAERITCPLPFDWMRGKPQRKLQMNFTRGCPYQCIFCPNHQGQRYRSGPADELWRFTMLAVADDLPLPAGTELAMARGLHDHLGVAGPPRLRAALHLLVRQECQAGQLRALLDPVVRILDPAVAADPGELARLTGLPEDAGLHMSRLGQETVSPWQIKQAWLTAKLALLASRRSWRQAGQYPERLGQLQRRAKPAFVLATSEDNTLVNRETIRAYLRRRIEYGISDDMIFNPGQNTVWDLTDSAGGADEGYIADLVYRNPFAVALGVDGPSNPVIRQNHKPRYGVGDALAVNRALARHGVSVANNYILLTPETDLLEAVEAFVLYLVLPLPWRDYGHSINLRVIKEESTLAHDEGLIFAPDDTGWDEPMRVAQVQELLDRWALTSTLASDDLPPLLWTILREDAAAASALPLVIERWLGNFDADPELLALGRLVSDSVRPGVPLVTTLQAIQRRLAADFPG
jgi:methylmalonyl-CoA mutase cobalamin-binding subunit